MFGRTYPRIPHVWFCIFPGEAKPATFGEVRLLGSWWPKAAAKGELQSIPVVTVPDTAGES